MLVAVVEGDEAVRRSYVKKFHDFMLTATADCYCAVDTESYLRSTEMVSQSKINEYNMIAKAIAKEVQSSRFGLNEATETRTNDMLLKMQRIKNDIMEMIMRIPKPMIEPNPYCQVCGGSGKVGSRGIMSFAEHYDNRWFKPDVPLSLKKYENLIRVSRNSARYPVGYISNQNSLLLYTFITNEYSHFYYEGLLAYRFALQHAIENDLKANPNLYVYGYEYESMTWKVPLIRRRHGNDQ